MLFRVDSWHRSAAIGQISPVRGARHAGTEYREYRALISVKYTGELLTAERRLSDQGDFVPEQARDMPPKASANSFPTQPALSGGAERRPPAMAGSSKTVSERRCPVHSQLKRQVSASSTKRSHAVRGDTTVTGPRHLGGKCLRLPVTTVRSEV